MGLTDNLRMREKLRWERTVTHPFVLEMGAGTLPKDRFRRYFIQDYIFMKALAKVVALAVAKAPDFPAAGKLTTFLQVLLGAEDDLFRRAFQEFGVSQEEAKEARATPTTTAFANFMLAVAHEGSYYDALTMLAVTEWTYLDWATRLAKEGKRPSFWVYQEWLDIHAAQELVDFVAWLRRQLDGVPPDAQQHIHVGEVFAQTLRYEYMFWEMAYKGEEWP